MSLDLIQGSMQAVQQLAQVAIIVYGFHLFVQQQITMGAIIATVILSGKAMAPLADWDKQ